MDQIETSAERSTASGQSSVNADLDSLPLTDSQLEYYNVLRKEHSDWKKELEKAKVATTIGKQTMSYIQIGVKQMQKFQDDIFEIEASFGRLDSLDEDIEVLMNKMATGKNKLSDIYVHSFNNIYQTIEQKISSSLIHN